MRVKFLITASIASGASARASDRKGHTPICRLAALPGKWLETKALHDCIERWLFK
jgi:hypothetical protein